MILRRHFLNADLDPPIYMEPLPGMDMLGYMSKQEMKNKVICVSRSMYGAVQSPRLFFDSFSAYLTKELGMEQSMTDPCIFYRKRQRRLILAVAVYLDDCLCIGSTSNIQQFYTELKRKYNIDELSSVV